MSERSADDRRHDRRHPYRAMVALLLSGGDRPAPLVLRSLDISAGGLLVAGSRALPVGAVGVMQLVRSDGRFALVGVEVMHSRYAGGMEHRCGVRFIPMPAGFRREDFLDADGRMVLLDPLLRQNCSEAAGR